MLIVKELHALNAFNFGTKEFDVDSVSRKKLSTCSSSGGIGSDFAQIVSKYCIKGKNKNLYLVISTPTLSLVTTLMLSSAEAVNTVVINSA